MMRNRWTSQNEKAKIAESYNTLYAQFSCNEVREVGNYTIIRLIGEGSFGKVYLANHKLTHTKVVLKTGAKDDPNLVREVYYHRQFSHPYITRLYEVIISEGLIWMVLEYCPGGELYDFVLSAGRIPIEEARKLFSQITAAVYYAHSLNCIHRDLKLENILLDKKRDAKLTDFGFTREFQANSLLDTVCGTTVYMAPELINKDRYDGFKVDIWSLGVILYTLLYGEMPFDEEDEMCTKAKIIGSEPNYRDDIPEDAVSLMIWLLEKDPKQRPSTKEILAHPFLEPLGAPLLDASDVLVKTLVNQKFFQSKTERHLLKKLKSLGIDIHQLQKSVISKNCDSLSGLWELLLEKQKKKQWKKYKARSRSTVLRITESTSRRVSQLMDPISSPPISRMVSIRSSLTNNSNSNNNNNNNNNRNSRQNLTATQNNTDDVQSQIGRHRTNETEKRKQGLMTKISQFFKIHHNSNKNSRDSFNSESPANSLVSKPSLPNSMQGSIMNNNSKQSSPNKKNSNSNNNNIKHDLTTGSCTNHTGSAVINTDLQSVSFNSNVLRSYPMPHLNEATPSPNTSEHFQVGNFRHQGEKMIQVKQAFINNDASAKFEQFNNAQPFSPSQHPKQQPQVSIKEPSSSLKLMNKVTTSSAAAAPTINKKLTNQTNINNNNYIPRPASMVSQHSLVSQYTFASDLSLNSTQSESTTATRPNYYRGVSSDTARNRRSLSLISSNSSTSSSMKGSFYDQSSSTLTTQLTGTSTGLGSSFKFLSSASSNVFGRSKKYNETAVFPKSICANVSTSSNNKRGFYAERTRRSTSGGNSNGSGTNNKITNGDGMGLQATSRFNRKKSKSKKNLIIEEEEYDYNEDDQELNTVAANAATSTNGTYTTALATTLNTQNDYSISSNIDEEDEDDGEDAEDEDDGSILEMTARSVAF